MRSHFWECILFAFTAFWALASAARSGSGSGSHTGGTQASGGSQATGGTQTLSIIIYQGDPVDLMESRHTALYIEYSNGRNVLSHVVGTQGSFTFDERWDNTDPTTSRHFARKVVVGTFGAGFEDLTVRNAIAGTRVNNRENSWNCQVFVGDALKQVHNHVPELTNDIILTAINGMTDAIMEATDEEE
jgi:hypothetical protein